MVGKGFTIMFSVLIPPQEPEIVYVIVCVPGPAEAGSNVPIEVFVIPGPLQIPPVFAAFNVKGVTSIQCGPEGSMVASEKAAPVST